MDSEARNKSNCNASCKGSLEGDVLLHAAGVELAKEQSSTGVVILTSSSSELFGSFGQANYGGAKARIYGVMRVLSIEGRKYGIRVMAIAPNAVTRMWANIPALLSPTLPSTCSGMACAT
ncbi:NAD(P)-dependent dehydrogenase (short-subunit alcohol dehydrogenase family) [Bradyrhizobium sp. GM22.5]